MRFRHTLFAAVILASPVTACEQSFEDEEDFRDLDIEAPVDVEVDALPIEPLEPEEDPEFGPCPTPREVTTCNIDVRYGTAFCDNGTPAWMYSFNGDGPLLRIQMAAWDVMVIDVNVVEPTGWWLQLSNSPSNDGDGGDAGDFSNDSEVQFFGDTLNAYRSDYGPSGLDFSQPNAIEPEGGLARLVVCDGHVEWTSSTVNVGSSGDYLFQIDGDEPDAEAGANDKNMWLGIGRTVGDSSRNGSGVRAMTITFGR